MNQNETLFGGKPVATMNTAKIWRAATILALGTLALISFAAPAYAHIVGNHNETLVGDTRRG